MDQAHDPHALDPSVERRIAGQRRLDNFRVSAVRDGSGHPAVRIAGLNSGTTTVGAPGSSVELLDAACRAFNAVILSGDPAATVVACIGDVGELRPIDETDRRRAKNRPLADALESEAVRMLENHL